MIIILINYNWLMYVADNACFDWLILGHYSPVIPIGLLLGIQNQSRKPLINSLLTLNVRS